jgi:hypothetical protein
MTDRQGIAMLNVLLVITLVMIFSLAVTNLGLFHYQTARRQESSLKASEAAQSGLAEAVRRLSLDPRLGTAGPTVIVGNIGEGSYEVRLGGSADLRSTNNLDGFLPKPGYGGRSVPAHTVHLLSIGTAKGGGRKVVEAIARLEALPFPVQSTGRVVANGLTVAGAGSPTRFLTGGERLPGSIYAGSSATNAIELHGLGAVTGDLRTPGQVSRDLTVVVSGQEYTGTSPLDVPDLTISLFDNSGTAGVQTVVSDNYGPLNTIGGLLGSPTGLVVHRLHGAVYIDGSVNITGPVLMENASVFVGNGGNLTINGPLTGKGSIFVTGKTELASGAMVNDDDQIAIFSQGDLEIKNSQLPLVSIFQGVLYSHSKIKLGAGVTVLGAVIAQAADPLQGMLEFGALNQVIHIPQHTAFASYWLARGAGGAPMKLVYWAELP